MLNVIFYTPVKQRETTYITYDTDGDEVEVTETQNYHVPKSFCCETMTSGRWMFNGDDTIESFTATMDSLGDATSMFDGTSIKQIGDDENYTTLSQLSVAERMFADCASLTSVKMKVQSLKNADEMFYGCSSLTSIDIEGLNGLQSAKYMFSESALTEFVYDLPSLIDGTSLFDTCGSFVSFSGSLRDVKYFDFGFFNNQLMTSFVTDSLDELISAEGCFYGTKITEWVYGLPELKNGIDMFNGVSTLTSFTSSLSSLENADGMFSSCQLDAKSVMYIVDSLPTHEDGDEHLITIGIRCTDDDESRDTFALDAEYDDWATLNEVLTTKGWTVTWEYNN